MENQVKKSQLPLITSNNGCFMLWNDSLIQKVLPSRPFAANQIKTRVPNVLRVKSIHGKEMEINHKGVPSRPTYERQIPSDFKSDLSSDSDPIVTSPDPSTGGMITRAATRAMVTPIKNIFDDKEPIAKQIVYDNNYFDFPMTNEAERRYVNDKRDHYSQIKEFQADDILLLDIMMDSLSDDALTDIRSSTLFKTDYPVECWSKSLDLYLAIEDCYKTGNASVKFARTSDFFNLHQGDIPLPAYIEQVRTGLKNFVADFGEVVDGKIVIIPENIGSLVFLQGVDQASFGPLIHDKIRSSADGKFPEFAALLSDFQRHYINTANIVNMNTNRSVAMVSISSKPVTARKPVISGDCPHCKAVGRTMSMKTHAASNCFLNPANTKSFDRSLLERVKKSHALKESEANAGKTPTITATPLLNPSIRSSNSPGISEKLNKSKKYQAYLSVVDSCEKDTDEMALAIENLNVCFEEVVGSV